MGIEKNTTPTIEDAENWSVIGSFFQKANNCDLTVKGEDPTTTLPAHPDWEKTTLLEERNGKNPRRLIELPGGQIVLLSYTYRDRN